MSNRTSTSKARPGFHLYFRAERGTINGIPARRNIAERCTCTHNGNHATAPTPR